MAHIFPLLYSHLAFFAFIDFHKFAFAVNLIDNEKEKNKKKSKKHGSNFKEDSKEKAPIERYRTLLRLPFTMGEEGRTGKLSCCGFCVYLWSACKQWK